MNATRTETRRASDRITLHMPIEASWVCDGGFVRQLAAQTLLVSRNGGILRLREMLAAGQELTLKRQLEGDGVKIARVRVVAEIDRDSEGFLYAVHIFKPHVDFWDIDFPAPHEAEDALARLLMECGSCQRREVVYLNEMELRSFEVRRCIARICRICDAPSVWVESQPQPRRSDSSPLLLVSDECVPLRRNRARVKARILACIRRRGFQEEIAVCEDLSKDGIAFRSRNQYPKGTSAEVAVPFTPGRSAIFVPIRIVFSHAISSAGLFRHGAAYLKPRE